MEYGSGIPYTDEERQQFLDNQQHQMLQGYIDTSQQYMDVNDPYTTYGIPPDTFNNPSFQVPSFLDVPPRGPETMSSFLMTSPYPQDYVRTDFPLLKPNQDNSQPLSISSVLQQRVADSYAQYVHTVTPTAQTQSYLSGPMMTPYQGMAGTSNDPSNLSSLAFNPPLHQQIPQDEQCQGGQQVDLTLPTSSKQVDLPQRNVGSVPVVPTGTDSIRNKVEQQQQRQQIPNTSSTALVPASRGNDRGRRGMKVSIHKTPVLYSESGFDMMGILSRVASRPNPQVTIGPVDFTCSFVVADARNPEEPIVYASPTFSELTGYELAEIIGRNCRFLQAPHGIVRKGETRRFTDDKAVGHIRKSLDNRQECQVSFINYRKNGDSFINLVTIIPIKWREGDDTDSEDEGNEDQYRYLVGFQVDLERQPNAILRTMRDGTYAVNYSMAAGIGDRSDSRYPPIAERLRRMLSGSSTMTTTTDQEREKLNALVLEQSDDFIHVLSLKGSIQYVSPSVRAVLEYDPEELSGKTISDITHPSDVVPVLRELKESSLPSAHASGSSGINFASTLLAQHYMHQARLVHLLFRVRRKYSGYIWIESTGRLQVEPGKGRKSLVFSGRIRRMPRLELSDLTGYAGLSSSILSGDSSSEVWSQIGIDGGLFLVVSTGAKEVLGVSAQDVMGTRLSEWLGPESRAPVEQALAGIAQYPKQRMPPTKLVCNRAPVDSLPLAALLVTIYRPADVPTEPIPSSSSSQPPPASTRGQRLSVVICHIRFATPNDTSSTGVTSTASSSVQEYLQQALPSSAGPGPSSQILSSPATSSNIFEELETTRGTSWQYELQQLRIQNEKMRKEIAAMERDQRAQLVTQPRQQQPQPPHAVSQPQVPPDHQHQPSLRPSQVVQQPQPQQPRYPPPR